MRIDQRTWQQRVPSRRGVRVWSLCWAPARLRSSDSFAQYRCRQPMSNSVTHKLACCPTIAASKRRRLAKHPPRPDVGRQLSGCNPCQAGAGHGGCTARPCYRRFCGDAKYTKLGLLYMACDRGVIVHPSTERKREVAILAGGKHYEPCAPFQTSSAFFNASRILQCSQGQHESNRSWRASGS